MSLVKSAEYKKYEFFRDLKKNYNLGDRFVEIVLKMTLDKIQNTDYSDKKTETKGMLIFNVYNSIKELCGHYDAYYIRAIIVVDHLQKFVPNAKMSLSEFDFHDRTKKSEVEKLLQDAISDLTK